MELTWIDDFLALEATRNFTRAADLRATTQSAYSRRIARLEDWLSCKLFKRDSRPIELTPEGAEFLIRAKNLRTDIMDARRAVQVLGSHYHDSLRIYTTNTVAVSFLPSWVRAQKISHYTVVVASVTACIEGLLSGRCDRAVIPVFAGDTLPDQVKSLVVGHDTLELMAVPDVADKIIFERGTLRGPMMMYTPGTRYGHVIDGMIATRGISLASDPVCESASAEALMAQVAAGLGAAWIPRALITDDAVVPCKVPPGFVIPYDIVMLEQGD